MKIVANNQLPHPSYLLLLLFQFFSLCVFYIRTYMCSSSGCAKSKAMFYYSFFSITHSALFSPNRPKKRMKRMFSVKIILKPHATCLFVDSFCSLLFPEWFFFFPFLSVFISVFLLFLLSLFFSYIFLWYCRIYLLWLYANNKNNQRSKAKIIEKTDFKRIKDYKR